MILFILLKINVVGDFSVLKFSDIHDIVLSMLKESNYWGSYHKHNCPSEICLLCHAIMLWFYLANLIFEKYTNPEPMQCLDDDEEAMQTVPRTSRPSFFVSQCILRNTLTQHTIEPERSIQVSSYSYSRTNF